MTAVIRPDDVRSRNRRQVLSAVRRGGVVSRTDISKKTGLSAATISAITSNLIADGILVPPPSEKKPDAGRGRPKVALTINPKAACVGAVIFRVNTASATIIDYAGHTLGEHTIEFSTSHAKAEDIKSALVDCLKTALENSGQTKKSLQNIAVGVQGVVDVDGTQMIWSPITATRNLPIKAWLDEEFDASTHVSNDCDMIALALNWANPDLFYSNFAAVLLANGVGMGLFLRGGLINGTRSSGAEFGHMTYVPGGALCRCGSQGCIEAYASSYAISRRAKNESESTPPPEFLSLHDIDDIADLARAGDCHALAAFEAAGAAIGTGLANMYALVDSFPVALVGSGAVAFDLMEKPLRDALSASMAGNQADDLAIDCYTDERKLVQEGCAASALFVQDEEMANRKSTAEFKV